MAMSEEAICSSGVLQPVRAQIEKHSDRGSTSTAAGAPFPLTGAIFQLTGRL